MRKQLVVLCLALSAVTPACAQLSFGIGLPNVSIAISLPIYPDLERIPGYPVYYAPRLNSNFFFYDGLYWVFQGDDWYASAWYNGPWERIGPERVPLYILRVPVRYYRQAPAYFHGWKQNSPPRWGDHWGNDWSQQRRGWDHWNRRSAPAPAPLPHYQKHYAGDRYPDAARQRVLRQQNYGYQPRDPEVRRQSERPRGSPTAATSPREKAGEAKERRPAAPAETRPKRAASPQSSHTSTPAGGNKRAQPAGPHPHPSRARSKGSARAENAAPADQRFGKSKGDGADSTDSRGKAHGR